MEDEEALEAGAHVRQLPHPVQHQVDDLLANGVVAASVVVGRVLLASDQLLRVEELAIGARPHLKYDDDDDEEEEDEELAVCLRPHLVHHRRLEVDEDGPWHVFSSSCTYTLFRSG